MYDEHNFILVHGNAFIIELKVKFDLYFKIKKLNDKIFSSILGVVSYFNLIRFFFKNINNIYKDFILHMFQHKIKFNFKFNI